MQTPEKDEYSRTRQQMTAHIDVCMGGRVAEELIFGPAQVHTPALRQGGSSMKGLSCCCPWLRCLLMHLQQ